MESIKLTDMNIRAILFDLDGVLVQSEHLYEEAKRRTLHHFGIDTHLLDITPYSGQTDLAFFLSMKDKYPQLRVPAEELARESERVFKDDLHTQMLPIKGASEVIHKAFARGLKIANVTSATEISQTFAMKLLEVEKYVTVRVNANNVTEFKPHPAPYLKALAELQVAPGNCLVIEDTMSGIRAGKAAGIKVAAFGTTFKRETLLAAGADYYFEDYDEVSLSLFGENYLSD